jgi:hypothetical protein
VTHLGQGLESTIFTQVNHLYDEEQPFALAAMLPFSLSTNQMYVSYSCAIGTSSIADCAMLVENPFLTSTMSGYSQTVSPFLVQGKVVATSSADSLGSPSGSRSKTNSVGAQDGKQ